MQLESTPECDLTPVSRQLSCKQALCEDKVGYVKALQKQKHFNIHVVSVDEMFLHYHTDVGECLTVFTI